MLAFPRKCKFSREREDSVCSNSTITTDFLNKRRGKGKRSKSEQSPDRSYDMITRRLAAQEDAKYAKFVYDITQEIVQKGSYDDKELCKIFKKHMKTNTGYLNEVHIESYFLSNHSKMWFNCFKI